MTLGSPTTPTHSPKHYCYDHRQLSESVEDLQEQMGENSKVLIDMRERIVRIETKLENISNGLTKQVDRASELFYRYGWPIILVALTAIVMRLLNWRTQ